MCEALLRGFHPFDAQTHAGRNADAEVRAARPKSGFTSRGSHDISLPAVAHLAARQDPCVPEQNLSLSPCPVARLRLSLAVDRLSHIGRNVASRVLRLIVSDLRGRVGFHSHFWP